MKRATGLILLMGTLLIPAFSVQANHASDGNKAWKYGAAPFVSHRQDRINRHYLPYSPKGRHMIRHLRQRFLSDGYLSKRERRILSHKRKQLKHHTYHSYRYDGYRTHPDYWNSPSIRFDFRYRNYPRHSSSIRLYNW